MVEFGEAGFLANLVLELVDGAGGIDGLDAPAVGADEVVPMLARDQEGEVGGSFVQAKPADHSLVTETLEFLRVHLGVTWRSKGWWCEWRLE